MDGIDAIKGSKIRGGEPIDVIGNEGVNIEVIGSGDRNDQFGNDGVNIDLIGDDGDSPNKRKETVSNNKKDYAFSKNDLSL